MRNSSGGESAAETSDPVTRTGLSPGPGLELEKGHLKEHGQRAQWAPGGWVCRSPWWLHERQSLQTEECPCGAHQEGLGTGAFKFSCEHLETPSSSEAVVSAEDKLHLQGQNHLQDPGENCWLTGLWGMMSLGMERAAEALKSTLQ